MTNMRRIIISAFSAVVLAALPAVRPANAQSGINSTVRVERNYEGRIANAVKSPLDTRVDDSLFNFRLKFDYTTFYDPYKDLYEFSPMMTLGPASEGKVVYPWFYARISAAYPWTPAADVYVTPRLGERFSFGVYFNHDSYWGNVPQVRLYGDRAVYDGQKRIGDRMKNRAGTFFGYRWKKGELKLDASYSGSVYSLATANYAMAPSRQEVWNLYSNRFDNVAAALSVRSTNPDRNAFYYNLDLGYRFFDNRQSIREHIADADISLGATIAGYHKLYLEFDGTFSGYGVWKLTPVYRWEKDRWRVKAGVTFSSNYGSTLDYGDHAGSRYLMYPDASVSFEAARNALWLYLNVYGDNKIYTSYDIFSINPWMDNTGIARLASTPFAAGIGLRGQVRDRFSYSLGADYALARNMLSFMSQQQGQKIYQIVAGGDSHVFTASGVLRWKSMDFFALAEVNYRYLSNPKAALMTPAFDLNAVLEYNLKQRLFIRADCYFRTATTGAAMLPEDFVTTLYRVPAFVDVGLRVSYAVNTRLMIFVEGNNLANSKIQYFLNYVEPGINIGAGICLKL